MVFQAWRSRVLATALLLVAGGWAHAQEPAIVEDASAVESPPSDRALFVTLYGSFATLQALDVVTTRLALNSGAVEINPLMRGLSNHTVAFAVVKGGQTAGTIWLTERLRRRNRVAAIALMAGIDAAYVVVVTHNLRSRNHGVGP